MKVPGMCLRGRLVAPPNLYENASVNRLATITV
jgi:hypothetical protein